MEDSLRVVLADQLRRTLQQRVTSSKPSSSVSLVVYLQRKNLKLEKWKGRCQKKGGLPEYCGEGRVNDWFLGDAVTDCPLILLLSQYYVIFSYVV